MREIDLAALATPAWAKELERTVTEFARQHHDALAQIDERAKAQLIAIDPRQQFDALALIAERAKAQLTAIDPRQQFDALALIAERAKVQLPEFDRLAHYVRSQPGLEKLVLGLDDNTHRLHQALDQDTKHIATAMRQITETASGSSRLVDDMVRTIPAMDTYRPYMAFLDQMKAKPVMDLLKGFDVPTLQNALWQTQPTMPKAAAHDIAQALSQDATDLADTLAEDDPTTVLAGILVLWQKLQHRFPSLGAKVFHFLLGLLFLLVSEAMNQNQKALKHQETKLDANQKALEHLETTLDTRAITQDRQTADLKRLLREALQKNAPVAVATPAVVRHPVPIRATASDNARILGRLSRGQHVVILASGRRWAQIETPTGTKTTKGWVRKKHLRKTS